MILYSQRNPAWASHALGWGPALGTIGAYGCLDTVDAMIATDTGHVLNPAQMDEAFTAAQIFVREATGTFDLLPDDALAKAFPGRYEVTSYTGYRGDLIKAAVPTSDTYAVLYISTAAVPTHFVIASSADGTHIIDPWTGTYGLLSGYGGPAAIHKTTLVKALATAPPVPPAPVPLPTPPPPDPPPIVVPPVPPTPTTYGVLAGDGFHVPHLVDLEDAKAVAVAYHNHMLVTVNVNDETTGNSVWETTGSNG
jgi:hypothetical protein